MEQNFGTPCIKRNKSLGRDKNSLSELQTHTESEADKEG